MTENNQTTEATRLLAQADQKIPEHDKKAADRSGLQEDDHFAHIESLLASRDGVDVRHQTLKTKHDVNLMDESENQAQ